jgi:hypothetical protein
MRTVTIQEIVQAEESVQQFPWTDATNFSYRESSTTTTLSLQRQLHFPLLSLLPPPFMGPTVASPGAKRPGADPPGVYVDGEPVRASSGLR